MPRSHRSYSEDSEDYGNPITVTRTEIQRPVEHNRRYRQHSPEVVQIVENKAYLGIPERGRGRASSTGGRAQPVINIINDVERSPSRSRSRHRRSSSSSSRGRHHRPHSREHDLDYQTRMQLEKLRLIEADEAARRAEERMKRDAEAKSMRRRLEDQDKKDREKQLRRQFLIEEKEEKEKEKEMRRRALLEEQEEKDKEKELRRRVLLEEKLREAEEKQKEKDAREKYVADYKREQQEKEDKKKKQKEEDDKKFEQRLREEFLAAGYSIESVEIMLHKRKEKDRREESNSLAIDLSRPTFIKVHRKYLRTETLDFYELPWQWDDEHEYIIIKRYISHREQEELFEHSRKLMERKLIAGPIIKETTLKVNDGVGRDGDGLYVVRRKSVSRGGKSPRRNSWLFT